MKRVLATILTILMAFGVLTVGAMADGDPTIRVSAMEGEPGDTVTVEVSMENNPGIMAFVLGLEYDETRLEEVKFSHTGLQGLWAMSENAVWVGNEDSTYEGVFLKLKFRVREDAPAGEASVTVTYGESDICNYDEEAVSFAVVSGGVTVSDSGAESAPEATGAPEATKTPENTKAPEATDKPETTEAPQSTDAPENTRAPESTKVPGNAEESESTTAETVSPIREEERGIPAEPEMDEIPQRVEGAIEVMNEVSHTAPVLENGNAREGTDPSGVMLLILLLAAVAVVLIVAIVVMLAKKGSYRGRH